MTLFSKEEIDKVIFKWEDLHGKTLKIFVGQQEGATCVMGFDVKTNHYYVLHNHFEEETK